MNLDAIDPTFVADLRASETAVWRVAQWLSARGHHVTVRALAVRPNPDERFGYYDAGDLEIIQRIEVKRRGLTFASAADYPYPTLLVDVAHAWDRAQPKPFAYVITNATLTAAAVIKSATSAQWRRVQHHDKGRDRVFYECPITLAEFVTL